MGSAEARGLQVIIGLDDLPKRVLGTAVAAIGVGMMAFYQCLEPGLDIGPFGVGFKAERIEGAALRIENLAALGRGPRMAGSGGAGLAEQRERVLGRPAGGGGLRPRPRRAARWPPIEPIFQVGRWPVMASF